MDNYEIIKILRYLSSSDEEMRELGVTLCDNYPEVKKTFPNSISTPASAAAKIRVLIKRQTRKL